MASQCGSGSSGYDLIFVGGNDQRINGRDISRTVELGGSTDFEVSVYTGSSAAGGAPLQWTLYDHTNGGAAAYVSGCTATVVAGTRTGTIEMTVRWVVPTPVPGSQGGPVNAPAARIAAISVTAPSSGGGSGTSCGNEYLQISLSGPYSYSTHQFDIMGPGTRYLWSTGYVNAQTFQPITPGTYTISVNTGYFAGTYQITVPSCGFARFIRSA